MAFAFYHFRPGVVSRLQLPNGHDSCTQRPILLSGNELSKSPSSLSHKSKPSFQYSRNVISRQNIRIENVSDRKSDNLTREEFDKDLENERIRICLVGMSNCGKSHWSAQLMRQMNFSLVGVDDEIEKVLEPELCTQGFSGIDGLAEWMGFPTDKKFARNQRKYLDIEEQVTANAAVIESKRNYVLDTTGSVIYLSNETLDLLRTNFLVIHLEASDDMMDVMIRNYFATPKPVVWADCFKANSTETPEQALRRCYPILLKQRRDLYSRLAHVTIPGAFARSQTTSLLDIVEYVRQCLPVVEEQC